MSSDDLNPSLPSVPAGSMLTELQGDAELAEHHRRLWLRHVLQTPQPARLHPQSGQPHVQIRTR